MLPLVHRVLLKYRHCLCHQFHPLHLLLHFIHLSPQISHCFCFGICLEEARCYQKGFLLLGFLLSLPVGNSRLQPSLTPCSSGYIRSKRTQERHQGVILQVLRCLQFASSLSLFTFIFCLLYPGVFSYKK